MVRSPRSRSITTSSCDLQEVFRGELAEFAKTDLVDTMHELLQPFAQQIVQDVCNDVRQTLEGRRPAAWTGSDCGSFEDELGGVGSSPTGSCEAVSKQDTWFGRSPLLNRKSTPFKNRFVKVNRQNIPEPRGASDKKAAAVGHEASGGVGKVLSSASWSPGPEYRQYASASGQAQHPADSSYGFLGAAEDHAPPFLAEDARLVKERLVELGINMEPDDDDTTCFGPKAFCVSSPGTVMGDFDPEDVDPRIREPLMSDEAMGGMGPTTLTPSHSGSRYSGQNFMFHVVNSAVFERVMGVVLLTNALVLGFETECAATQHWSGETDEATLRTMGFCEACFCLVFTIEVSCRMLAFGLGFFTDAWNLFDFVIVIVQVIQQIFAALPRNSQLRSELPSGETGASVVRIMRMLRYVRITRVIRMIRLVEELRTIFSSITSSMLSLAWTLLLLCMLLYMVSVFFTQVVLEASTSTEHSEDLRYWYGSLGRTYLTMFECIFSGVSWDAAVVPLIDDIHPALGFVYMAYIAFCMLVMMNMATGVFVDNAIKKAQEDKDTNTANHISDLFFDSGADDQEAITYQQFCSKIDTPDMQEYFRAINVDPSEAKGLYRLLDADGSGSVDAEEMVSGCLRLRGNAKALELQLLTYETNQMHEKMKTFQARCERCLAYVCGIIEAQTKMQLDDPLRPPLRSSTFKQLPRKSQMRGLSAIGFTGKLAEDLDASLGVLPEEPSQWTSRDEADAGDAQSSCLPPPPLPPAEKDKEGTSIARRRDTRGDDSLMGYNPKYKGGALWKRGKSLSMVIGDEVGTKDSVPSALAHFD